MKELPIEDLRNMLLDMGTDPEIVKNIKGKGAKEKALKLMEEVKRLREK